MAMSCDGRNTSHSTLTIGATQFFGVGSNTKWQQYQSGSHLCLKSGEAEAGNFEMKASTMLVDLKH